MGLLAQGFAIPRKSTTKPSSADQDSTNLRIKLELVREALFRHRALARTSHRARERYKDYLFVLHSVVRSSVPLMEAAEGRCAGLRRSGLMDALRTYFHAHAREERDHDRWLLEDLELVGVPRREVLSRKPLQGVAELVGSQYYWIHHFHPVCLLGYIAVLEGYPPDYADLVRLRAETAYPKSAFRTLTEHSSLDKHHIEDFWEMYDSLPLDKRQEEWITLNGIYTLSKWKEIVELLDKTPRF